VFSFFYYPFYSYYPYYSSSYYLSYPYYSGYSYYPSTYGEYRYVDETYEEDAGELYGAVEPVGTSANDLLATGSRAFADGDYVTAADAFLQAAVQVPESAVARFAYGHALFAMGRYEAATDSIRAGLELDPTWVSSKMDRRQYYRDPAQFEEQLAALGAYVNAHPDNAEARFLLAYNLYFSDRKGEALSQFELLLGSPLDREAELFTSAMEGSAY